MLLAVSTVSIVDAAGSKKRKRRPPTQAPTYAENYWEKIDPELAAVFDDHNIPRPTPLAPGDPAGAQLAAEAKAFREAIEAKYPIDPEVRARTKAWTLKVEPNGDMHAVPYVDE